MTAAPVHALSSMATRELLAALAQAYGQEGGSTVQLESVGGVEVARRVRAGESCDVVILAQEALATLEREGHLAAGSAVAIADSPVAVAVRAGAPLPDIGSEAALRRAIVQAERIAVSTGPSGTYLLELFAKWGVAETLGPRLVQAPPGVAVGTLLAAGEATLGFQQRSELLGLDGIEIVGDLPAGIQRMTTFAGALCASARQAEAGRAWLSFLAAPQNAPVMGRHGMTPPNRSRG